MQYFCITSSILNENIAQMEMCNGQYCAREL